MNDAIGVGHFVTWDGGAMFISRATAVTPIHSHYALQISFGSQRGIRFRPSDRDEWTEYDGVVIPPQQPHAMDASRVPYNAVLLIEPETREGRALQERFDMSAGIVPLSADILAPVIPELFAAWLNERSVAAVAEAGQRVVRALAGGIQPAAVSDERILRAIAYINRHLEEPLTLQAIAREAYLSPGRFRHLFVEQTGMALRPYILWRRFLRVWELAMAGESLSAAAHRAGFADAAHLTRTSRRIFGFPPSALRPAEPLRPRSRTAR